MSNPYESFYHGLVVSKIWLCEELEKITDQLEYNKPHVKILGSWHNLMAFMMLVRRPKGYSWLNCYDMDESAITVADQICNTWIEIEEPHVTNHVADVLKLDFSSDPTDTVYINCSVDQFDNESWYSTIPNGSIVCMQTTDLVDDSQNWDIVQKTKDLNEFTDRYKMSNVIYQGVKKIPYRSGHYNRLMVIGVK